WYKVLFAIEPEKMQRLMDYVSAKGWKDVDFVRSSKEYYEILPQNISKGSALKKMREICGFDDFTIVAMGDYNNDIEMLEAADFAVCPSNAVADVKAICDLVLEVSCEEDAVAHTIDFIYKKLGRS
ncbi:MAG: HAD hydrolase family protein, partial [Ruminococcus sp.]|nr:HAD hydrolase family protein [Ruminococcus sp.]